MAEMLSAISALAREGRFETAFQKLDEICPRWPSTHDRALRLIALELLERTGRLPAAKKLIASFKSRAGLSVEERARMSTVEGLVAKHLGHITEAEQHFLQACQFAEQSDSLELLCWAQLRLLGVAVDSATKDRVPAIRSELRRNVERTGSPNVSVAFHIFSAEHEAKHGQLPLSRFHGEIAESLLRRHPNTWLIGLLDLQKSCLSYLEGNFTAALRFAQSAFNGSMESGHVQTRLLALGDMAAAYLAVGQPARATRCVACAMQSASPDEQVYGLMLETLAEGQLESRDLAGCAVSLARAESIASSLNQRRSAWCQNWNLRTKIRLLQRRGEWEECLSVLRNTTKSIGPSFSDSQIQVLEALALSKTGQPSTAALLLCRSFARPIDASPLLQGLVQTAVAGLIASEGAPGLALNQYSRALRILAATGESSELVESVDQYIDAVRQKHGSVYPESAAQAGVTIWRPIRVRCHLERATELTGCSSPGISELAAYLSSVVDLASEPQALGEESLRTLAALAWIDEGCVERTSAGGTREVLVSHARLAPLARPLVGAEESREVSIALGSKAGDVFHLRIAPKQNSEAAVGCGAAARMILALASFRTSAWAHTPPCTTRSDIEVVSGKWSIFRSPAMTSLVAGVRRIAPQNITVLLTGESGTGKEVVANLIHEAAGSSGRPFVVFNCATVPTDMIESQLFGYRRGAFTGAVDSFMGVIRAAEGGTLFLDEVAELPIATQPKLLRFLDAFEVQPLGEALPHRVKVRVIAATNADLEQRVKDGRFRADLFYRLDVVRFHLPPLRERREDIRPLAETFLVRATEEIGKIGVKFGEDTIEHLLLNPWPGNVRQLLHEIRRIAAFAESEATVHPDDLDPRYVSDMLPRRPEELAVDNTIRVSIDRPLYEVIREVEAATLKNALIASNWRNDEAAKRLGLSRKGLYLKRRRLGIADSDS